MHFTILLAKMLENKKSDPSNLLIVAIWEARANCVMGLVRSNLIVMSQSIERRQ